MSAKQGPVPGPDTVCKCGHWYEEHDKGGECRACAANVAHHADNGIETGWVPCKKYEFDPEQNTIQAIASRGGDPACWPAWMKAELRKKVEFVVSALKPQCRARDRQKGRR